MKKRGRMAGYGRTEVMTVRFTHCRELQRQVVELAKARGVSVNQLIVEVLREHFVANQEKPSCGEIGDTMSPVAE